jgi:hypothetical protein
MKPVIAIALLHLTTFVAAGQTAEVRARVISAESRTPLPGAYLTLTIRTDPSFILRTIADTAGNAVLSPVPGGLCRLEVHHVGHFPHSELIQCGQPVTDAGTIALRTRTIQIDEVVIRAEAEIQQKGDTTEYLADAFRMSEGSSVEDLLQQLPGLNFSGGTIRTGMNDVAEILLDGTPIPTGGDRQSMLQAIPSTSIERVQLYERLSEDAEFTGFDDGERRTTINLVSKGRRLNMTSVNASAAYGESGRYEARGGFFRMDGARRLSLSGGYASASGTGSTLDPAMVLRDPEARSSSDAGQVFNPSSRRTTRGSGLAGFNEQWDGGYASATYLFSRPGSEDDVARQRRSLLPGNAGSLYNEHRTSTSVEYTHSFTGRLELAVGEYTSAVFTPRLTVRSGESERRFTGERTLPGTPSSTLITTENRASTSSGMLGGSLFLRQRFELPGRTLSLELGYTRQDGERGTDMKSRTSSVGATGGRSDTLIQTGKDSMPSAEFKSRLLFTEPLTVSSRMQFEYMLVGSHSSSSLRTSTVWPYPTNPGALDPATSGSFEQRVTTHRAGSAYQLRMGDILLTGGLAYEQTTIGGEEGWPAQRSSTRSYGTFLPSASLKVDAKSGYVRLRYSASSIIPTIGQTQEVVDNAHPMYQTIGNSRLQAGVQHRVDAQYTHQDGSGIRYWINARGGLNSNGICRAITVFDADTTLSNGAAFLPGGELTSYVNQGGAWNAITSFEISLPVSALSSRFSLGTSGNVSSTPWFTNGVRERTRQWSLSPDITLHTKIDTTMDIHSSYAFTYRSSTLSDRGGTETRACLHTVFMRWTWRARRWITFESALVIQTEAETRAGMGTRAARWNLTIGLAPLGPRRFEIRLEGHDLLNTDRSAGRTITDTYVEDTDARLLPRYFLINASYFWN